MVDRAALEMQCTARYRGFESLPLRQLELTDRLTITVSLIGPFQLTGGMRTRGFGEGRRPNRRCRRHRAAGLKRSAINPSLSASWK